MKKEDADDSAYWDDVIDSSDPEERRRLVVDAVESVSGSEDGSFAAFYGAHDDWETAMQFSVFGGEIDLTLPIENGARRIRRRILELDGFDFDEEAGAMGYTEYTTSVETPEEAADILETVYSQVLGFPDEFEFKIDVKTLSEEDLKGESGL
ncbi:MAG: hypothetical protein SV253_01865 [Halobacteria archaeon]|nr:hypothetical protein [Halobacteria archaeon]